jgi:hypothetical protein
MGHGVRMMALAEPLQGDESCRRGAGRAPLAFPAKLALSDGNFNCVLEDLSLGGARISCDRSIEPGREIWLKFDRYNVFGTSAWFHDGECGIEFEERIPKRIVLEMQEYAANPEEYEKHQSIIEAEAHVLGAGPDMRSPLMRLLDVVGPISREKFSECPQCERGDPCSTHCGQKRFKRAQFVRAAFYLALAALIGAASGIVSVLFG